MAKKNYIGVILFLLLLFGCAEQQNHVDNHETSIHTQPATSTEEYVTDNEQNILPERILLATSEYPPYVSRDLEGNGFATEIIVAAFAEVDIEVEIIFVPWKRAIEMVEKGECFGSYTWFLTEERKQTYLTSAPIAMGIEQFFYIKSAANIPADFHSKDDLSGLRVGGVNGYTHIIELEKLGVDVDVSNDDQTALHKLLNGRVDLVPLDPYVAEDLITNQFREDIDQFSKLQTPFISIGIGIISRKVDPNTEQIMQQFNKGLEAIRESGVYDEIILKHKVQERAFPE